MLINHKEIKQFDKKILVPFGEFLPLRNLLQPFQIISGPNDYSIGDTSRNLSISSSLKLLPVICYEVIFYWKLLDTNNYRSNLIINITNDIWFGNYIGPYQHLYLAKLRAAEYQKPLLRASNNGISAVVDEKGKILVNTKLNQKDKINYLLKIYDNENYLHFHNYYNLLLFLYFMFIIIIKKNNI